jgi:hypothetical protein
MVYKGTIKKECDGQRGDDVKRYKGRGSLDGKRECEKGGLDHRDKDTESHCPGKVELSI